MFAQSKHQAACGLSGPRGFESHSRRFFCSNFACFLLALGKKLAQLLLFVLRSCCFSLLGLNSPRCQFFCRLELDYCHYEYCHYRLLMRTLLKTKAMDFARIESTIKYPISDNKTIEA
jgi:hypothetical protein